MSYTTIAQCATDSELQARLLAAIASEAFLGAGQGTTTGDQVADHGPTIVLGLFTWPVAAAADIEAAYASALAAGNPHPGADPAVITDAMILGNVQAAWPADVA